MSKHSVGGRSLAGALCALALATAGMRPASAATISGQVYDAATGKPVRGASLRILFDSEDAQPGAEVPAELLSPGQQGQVTDADGRYQFDVPAGRRYRLAVEAQTSTYSFPSNRFPPRPGLAAADGDGQVVAAETPAAPDAKGADRSYYLRFDVTRATDSFSNNHVALDPLAAVVTLEKRADRPEASTGDIVLYTLTVVNRSNRDLTGAVGRSIYVLDAPARGLSYLAGRAVARVGGTAVRGFEPPRAAGARLIRFGPFDLAAGQTLTLQYQVAVGIDTRPGKYRNRAVVVDAGGVELSREATETVRIVADSTLETGSIVGRVFCDADADGALDAGEPGFMGARVYVETGSYAVSDSQGFYHLSRVVPGTHLVKLDQDSLAGGSLVSPESQLLRLSSGLSAKVSFAVRCAGVEVRADRADVTAGGAAEPAAGSPVGDRPEEPSRPAFLRGDVRTMSLEVDGEQVALPSAEITLEAPASVREPQPAGADNLKPAPRTGYGDAAPAWRARWSLPASSRPSRWALVISRVRGSGGTAPVRVLEGEGTPPAAIAWDGLLGDGKPAPRGTLYAAQLVVTGGGGRAEAASAIRVFGVGVAVAGAGRERRVLRGDFFVGSERKPRATDALKAEVAALARELGPEDTLEIETHYDGTGARLRTIARTQREAALVADLLAAAGVSAERVKPRGRGSLEPLDPGRTAAARRTNRRVVVLIERAVGTGGASIPARLEGEATARLGSESVTVDANGRFEKRLAGPRPKSIRVELVAADGRRALLEVRLAASGSAARSAGPGRGAAPTTGPTRAGDEKRVRVRCDLRVGRCAIGGRAMPAELLGVGVVLPSPVVATEETGGALRLRVPLEFSFTAPEVPGDSVAEWQLLVRDSGGAVVHAAGSDLVEMPTAHRWDGTAEGSFVLRPGEVYSYRLSVAYSSGPVALSPERSFTLDRVGSPEGEAELSMTGRLFTGAGLLSARLKNELSEFASTVASRPESERYRVELQVRAPGESATERRLAVAGRRSRLRKYLRRLGVDESRLEVKVSQGATDSVSISTVAPARPEPPEAVVAPASVRIDGVEQELRGDIFETEVELTPSKREVVLEVTSPTGHRAVLPVNLPPGSGAVDAAGREGAREAGRGAGEGRASAGAVELRVRLPEKGTVLQSSELAVTGRTDPQNRVFVGVNEVQEVRVARDGRFAGMVKLPSGKSELWIRAVDPKGNRSVIRWPVEVSGRQLFVMGLAEGIAAGAYTSRGWLADFAYLDGMNEDTTVGLGPMLVHGRAAAYLKARVNDWRGFDEIRVTGQIDTARTNSSGAFFEEVVDPTAAAGGDFPAYGDSAEEVRDVNTRGKLYLRVEADDSEAIIGSVHTGLRGGDLFQYDRTLSGALVDVDRKVAAHRLQVKSFVSGETGRLASDVNWYRATGGSLYYLRRGHVVEGSERLRVVIRDRDMGTVLAERMLVRNRDYTMDYSSGRILLVEPLGSTAASPWLVDNFDSSVTPLGGNPVYLEARYEHEDPGADGGRSAGLAVRDSAGRLELGAGVVSESRGGDSDYTLWGADASVRLGARSRIGAEIAASRAFDAANYISQDGGISFLDFDHTARTTDADGGIPGIAETNSLGARPWQLGWKLSGDIYLGDFAKDEDPKEPARKRKPLHLGHVAQDSLERGWLRRFITRTRFAFTLQNLDRGFSAGGSLPEQGRFKLGALLVHELNTTDRVLFRHVAEVASLPRVGPTQQDVDAAVDALAVDERATYLSALQWSRDRGRWHYRIEGAMHRLSSTAALADGSPALDAQRLGVGGSAAFDYSDRLTLRAGQQVVAGLGDRDPFLEPIEPGDSSRASSDALAGVATNLGADVRLTRQLSVGTDWYQRWNGDNAAQLSLKSALSSQGSMYVRERVESLDGGMISTTAVGAEERFGAAGAGRRYGEYQIESGVLGQRNRAVLGLGHRWSVGRGFRLGAGIEHQQIFGGALPDGTPVGNAQRNVLHGSAEYTFRDRLKTAANVELRFDDGLDTGLADLVSRDPRPVGGPGDYPDHGGVAPGAPAVLPPVDRIQVLAGVGAGWKATHNHTILGRLRLAHTGVRGETGVRDTAARFSEATGGFAYRPIAHDWLHLLARYSYLRELRPVTGDEARLESRSHVVAVVPVADLPWRLTLAGKIAFKRTEASASAPAGEGLVSDTNATLALVRLGYRFYGRWDASGELRTLILDNPNGAESRTGTLFEAGYRLNDWVRMGIGYNLSRFSDNELGDLQRDSHGFFVRLTGQY